MATIANASEPIAIIGMGCRFPGGANRPSKLWELLRNPRDLTQKPPHTRFNIDGFYNPYGDAHGMTNSPGSYFLEDDVRLFDNQFFNITPKEAEAIDPQQRLLLETVYESMEHAGLTIKGMEGSPTSVYVGLMCQDWADLQLRDINTLPQYAGTGNHPAIISNRVSYFFDWKGPSMTIDTACSSSLVALHEAVRSLRSRESNIACAAGANLILGPDLYVSLSNLHMLSPNGRSRMWDVDADGYARGEGIAAVMLKRLSDAIADGDHIEAVVRETGVNSDGRTKGITMPSMHSQESLVRSAYMRAGLDINDPSGRPQYFEAHGTGTQAGDLQEASAIHASFFGNPEQTGPKLIVGGIKTITGHTEGASGLAGLIKTTLALQNGLITPNLHLDRLNPVLEPFMANLEVPTVEKKWPSPPANVPRRASVNSFGFGGTNGHAILEHYDPLIHNALSSGAAAAVGRQLQFRTASKLPLLFSATSEEALLAMVRNYADHLRSRPETNLQDLSWTLQARRSTFAFKIAFSNTTHEHILKQMDEVCANANGIGKRTRLVSGDSSPRILGVFTGQGAQWAAMGSKLYQRSKLFRKTLHTMEESLSQLPEPPNWSLVEELLHPATKSRIGEAALSQPLCTAVQVALLDLLTACGIKFSAVVGHSSGEITAAVAAGYVTPKDAIRIAYYRGLYAHLAQGQNGAKGAMMATGFGRSEAETFCSQEKYRGRIVVAASNSATSVTLSGDEDAVKEAQNEISATGTFARLLAVDTAYHSAHMQKIGKMYVDALQGCGASPILPAKRGIWFSSAQSHHGDPSLADLSADYWRDNMVNPVLFTEALRKAAETIGPFDACLEIGPHPALKGPATQTLKDVLSDCGPYFGVLDRKKDDAVAFSDAMAGLWVHTGADTVDFNGLLSTMDQDTSQFCMLQDLPLYPWQHSQPFWKESRASERFRLRESPHELLGSRIPTDSDTDMRWHNVLKVDTIPWIQNHRFNGQNIVPAAGYCTMAIEAAKSLCPGADIKHIELRQMNFDSAIVVKEQSSGIEVLCSLRPHSSVAGDVVLGEFAMSAGPADGSLPIKKVCSATVAVRQGNLASDSLPTRDRQRPKLNNVDLGAFHDAVNRIGLEYSGSFRGHASIERRLYSASAVVGPPAEINKAYYIHPATFDVCIQTLFAAFSAPGDGAMWTSFLPRRIQNLTIDLSESQAVAHARGKLTVDCHVTNIHYPTEQHGASFESDVQIFSERTSRMAMQIEGLEVQSFDAGNEGEERQLVARDVWRPDILSKVETRAEVTDPAVSKHYATVCRRIALFYLRELVRLVPTDAYIPRLTSLPKVAAAWIQSLLQENPHWELDTTFDVQTLVEENDDYVDPLLLKTVGERLPAIAREGLGLSQDELLRPLLDRLPSSGLGSFETRQHLNQVVGQLSHKHPNMHVLEFGFSDPLSRESVLEGFAGAYNRYTYSYSSGSDTLGQGQHLASFPRTEFKALNPLTDLESQGLHKESYELVIVSDPMVHSLNSIGALRKLVRPGGYLLVAAHSHDNVRNLFLALTQLAASTDVKSNVDDLQARDGFKLSPPSPLEWDSILRTAGFSGIDAIANEFAEESGAFGSVILTQAVNEKITMLRQPMLQLGQSGKTSKRLLIVGGATLETSRFAAAICTVLREWKGKITRVESFAEVQPRSLKHVDCLLCLEDLDRSFIESFTNQTWDNMKAAVLEVTTVLWLLRGAQEQNPYHAALLGMGRVIAAESPHIYFQFLDLDKIDGSADFVAQSLIRLQYAESIRLKSDKTLLWPLELELVYEASTVMLPRIIASAPVNNRLNALRYMSTRKYDIANRVVALDTSTAQSGRYSASCNPLPKRVAAESVGKLDIAFSATSLKAVNLGRASAFLGVGVDGFKGKKYLVALRTNTSSSLVSTDEAVVLKGRGSETWCLQTALARVIAREILSIAPSTGTIIVQEPGLLLTTAIAEASVTEKKEFVFISRHTQSINTHLPATCSWRYIHARASKRAIKSSLPLNAALFLDCSKDSDRVVHHVQDLLPGTCITQSAQDFFSDEATLPYDDDTCGDLKTRLVELSQPLELPSEESTHSEDDWSRIGVSRLLGGQFTGSPFTIVDWRQDQTISIRTTPLDPASLFGGNKTYLFVGLTGELGLSICRWMVKHGARDFVLSSRNPKVDSMWKQELEAMGATIRLEQCDVTNKQQVMNMKARIHNHPYPIAGVFNGAMVMADQPFYDMSADSMRKVLRPKVDGTRHLDEAFWNDPLDFFIVTSSVAAAIGNPGQANYASGNQFMAGIAAKRRKRGVVGTAIDLGAIVGIGYIFSSSHGSNLMQIFKKRSINPMSETDVHDVIAEAILAGRPGPEGCSELITSLRKADLADPTQQPNWLNDPRFSHMVYDSKASGAGVGTSDSSSSSQSQLMASKTVEDVAKALQEVFSTQLSIILQMAPGSLKTNVPLMELGADSLVAVEIRSWLLTNTGQDVPVLTILGGASASDICKEIAPAVFEAISSGNAEVGSEIAAEIKADSPTVPLAPAEIPRETATPKSDGPHAPVTVAQADRASESEDSDSDSDDERSSGQLRSSMSSRESVEEDTDNKGAFSTEHSVQPLSYGQSRIWFPAQFTEDHSTYNCAFSYRLGGHLNVAAFEKAIWSVTQRHEALRTAFHTDPHTGEGMQTILPLSRFSLKVVESANETLDVETELKRMESHRFDLQSGKTFAACLLVHSPMAATVVLGYHHIVLDGVSWQLLLQDVERYYNNPDLKQPSPSQYPAFAQAQRRLVEQGKLEQHRKFWQSELESPPEPLPMFPFSKVSARKAVTRYDTVEIPGHIEPELLAKMKKASRALKTTAFHLHLAVLQVLLHRFLAVEDLCIGVVDANRNDPEHMQTLGFMLNMLPLRFRVSADQTFDKLAQTARAKTYSALGHSSVPWSSFSGTQISKA